MSQHEPEWPIVHIAMAVLSPGALKTRTGDRSTSPAGATSHVGRVVKASSKLGPNALRLCWAASTQGCSGSAAINNGGNA